MSELERLLLQLVRAHALAATPRTIDSFDASLELRADLGFDVIALAELAVVLEDAFGIAVDLADLDRCLTIGELKAWLAGRGV
jgi:acyl carrier protein